MTEETEAVAEDDVAAAAQEGAEAADPGAASAEDQALRMGWVPKEQFKGDAAKWVDAETFIRRGEEFLPFLKANNKKLESALDKAHRELAEVKKTLKEFGDYHAKTEERALDRARKELEARLEDAAAAGDVDAVRAVNRELVDLNAEAAKPKPGRDDGKALLDEWKGENTWFDRDSVMRGAAVAIADELAERGVTGRAQLDEVTRRIKAEFPHKFENPNRSRPAAVEGAGAPRRSGAKTYSDLPAEAKAQCDRFCQTIKGFTREQFVKDYQWA